MSQASRPLQLQQPQNAAPLPAEPALLRALGSPASQGILLLLAAAFFLLRFVHLAADYPTSVRWEDAILTDEGWYAAAAINQHAWGLPLLSGDLNTAVLLPVWPLLAQLSFHFFGYGIEVLRGLSVLLSLVLAALSAALLRRYALARFAPLLLLLLATNPWLFAISRGAFLESLMLSFSLAALLLAQRPRNQPSTSTLRLFLAGLLLGLALLSKSSALLLAPVLALALAQGEAFQLRATCRSLAGVFLTAAAIVTAYYAWAAHRFANDVALYLGTLPVHTTLSAHGLAAQLTRPFRYGAGADRLLLPLGVFALLATLAPRLRALWRQPLFALAGTWVLTVLCALALANNVMVHYFVLVVPALVLLGVALLSSTAIRPRYRSALLLLLLTDAAINAAEVLWIALHPTYTVHHAEQQIGATVARDTSANHVVLGDNAHQSALVANIQPVNLFAHSAYLSRQVRHYSPDWWLAYAPEDNGSCYRVLLSQAYAAELRGSWTISQGRTWQLYRLHHLPGRSLPVDLTGEQQRACRSPYVARQHETSDVSQLPPFTR